MFLVLVCIVASIAYSEGGTHIEIPQNLGIDPQHLKLGISRPFNLAPQNLGLRIPQGLGFRIPQHLGLGIPNINRAILRNQLLPSGVTYAVHDVPENDVSYTLSYQDYEFLKRHKVHGQDSPYNPEPDHSPPIDYITGTNDHSHHDSNYGIQNQNHDKHSHDHEKRSDNTSKKVKQEVPCSDILLKRSAASISIDGFNNFRASGALEPVVHKHVYFHVPPPEFDDEPEQHKVIQAPKKNVNIIFVKAPSYESNFAYQQPVEDKTLIYVLSKKEDPPQTVVLPPKPSSVPEVFFVNYKFGPNDITSINNEFSLPSLLANIHPITDRQKRETR